MTFVVIFLFTAAVLLALSDSETVYRPVAKWVPASNGNVPANAVLVGAESQDTYVYVCRAKHEGDNIPGKLVPFRKLCYVPWYFKEHPKQSYEVLTVPYGFTLEWISIKEAPVPVNAVQGGIKANGVPLYIGRVTYKGVISGGKVDTGGFFFPLDGVEHLLFYNFEVLVAKKC